MQQNIVGASIQCAPRLRADVVPQVLPSEITSLLDFAQERYSQYVNMLRPYFPNAQDLGAEAAKYLQQDFAAALGTEVMEVPYSHSLHGSGNKIDLFMKEYNLGIELKLSGNADADQRRAFYNRAWGEYGEAEDTLAYVSSEGWVAGAGDKLSPAKLKGLRRDLTRLRRRPLAKVAKLPGAKTVKVATKQAGGHKEGGGKTEAKGKGKVASAEAEGKIAGAEGKIAGAEGKIAGAEGKIAGAEGKIAGAEGKIASAEAKVTRTLGSVAEWGKIGPLDAAMFYLQIHEADFAALEKVSERVEIAKDLLSHVAEFESGAHILRRVVDRQGIAEYELPSYPLQAPDPASPTIISPLSDDERAYVSDYHAAAARIMNDALNARIELNKIIAGWDAVLIQAKETDDFTRKSAWDAVTELDLRFSKDGNGFRAFLVEARDRAGRYEYWAKLKMWDAEDILGLPIIRWSYAP